MRGKKKGEAVQKYDIRGGKDWEGNVTVEPRANKSLQVAIPKLH